MIWHIARAFTEHELWGRADNQASVDLRYELDLGYYQFRVRAGTREGLVEALRFVGAQVDRMIEEAQSGS
jgi:hypothetical protein